LAANGMTVADVDWLIPHQANRRILAATAKRLGLPEEIPLDYRVFAALVRGEDPSAAVVTSALTTDNAGAA
jgi:3-oxoacyl-[acyl-carrier-protein] synthase-3